VKSLGADVEKRRQELQQQREEDKKKKDEQIKQLAKDNKEKLKTAKGKDAKGLDPAVEAKRKELQQQREAKKKQDEVRREGERKEKSAEKERVHLRRLLIPAFLGCNEKARKGFAESRAVRQSRESSIWKSRKGRKS
jgi:hypothetical protein